MDGAMQAAWDRTKSELSGRWNQSTYNLVLGGTKALGFENGVLTLRTGNNFAASQICGVLGPSVREVFSKHAGQECKEIVLSDNFTPAAIEPVEDELTLAKRMARQAIQRANEAEAALEDAQKEIEALRSQLEFERQWAGATGRGGGFELPEGHIIVNQHQMRGMLLTMMQNKSAAWPLFVMMAYCNQAGVIEIPAAQIAITAGYCRRTTYTSMCKSATGAIFESTPLDAKLSMVVHIPAQDWAKNAPKLQENVYKDTPIYVYDDELKNNHMDIESSSYGGQAVTPPDTEEIIKARCEELGRIGFHWRKNLKRFKEVLPRIPADTWEQMLQDANGENIKHPPAYVFNFMEDFKQRIGVAS